MHILTGLEHQQFNLIHHWLSMESYWSQGICKNRLYKAMQHSMCFGVFENGQQIGFCRVVTDKATFANLLDVYIDTAHRGKGHGKALMNAVMQHPELQGLRRFTLATKDAHSLYQGYGFDSPDHPESLMEKRLKQGYASPA